jgi:hypothetical protein
MSDIDEFENEEERQAYVRSRGHYFESLRCLMVQPDDDIPGNIAIATKKVGETIEDLDWRSLDFEVALIQIKAFMESMKEGDGIIHRADVPQTILDLLEPPEED